MTFDWRILREPTPTTLAGSRQVAHYAVQWVARAAVANLPAAPDDSHSALAWDATLRALVSAALPGDVTVGLQLESLELLVTGDAESERLALHGLASSVVDVSACEQAEGAWMQDAFGGEAALHRPGTNVEQGARPGGAFPLVWGRSGGPRSGGAKHGDLKPGPGPVRCWPHHFDIAVLVRLEEGAAESVRSIGVGCAPGDEYYPEPYFYVRSVPGPEERHAPRAPAGWALAYEGFLCWDGDRTGIPGPPGSSRGGSGGHRRSVRSGTRMARCLRNQDAQGGRQTAYNFPEPARPGSSTTIDEGPA